MRSNSELITTENNTVSDLAYENLKSDIEKWKLLIQSNPDYYDLAFFKIVVKFEVYLVEVFREYVSGNGTKFYTPERRINFENINHFELLIRSTGNRGFIDYVNILEDFSTEVFALNKNPFKLFLADARIKPLYKDMRTLRNYIAHESNESKRKYVKEVLNNQEFIEPNVHLKKKKRNCPDSWFSIYIKAIEDSASILNNPTPYF